MTWVRLDDGFADHPKIEAAGPMAAWLHVAALCYCARHLTDGRVPKVKARRLVDIPSPGKHIAALVAAGLWLDDGDDYVIHDYLDYQPSRAQVEVEREKERDKKRRQRESGSSTRNGDGTFAGTPKGSPPGTADGTPPGNHSGSPSVPDPTRPSTDLHLPSTNGGTRPVGNPGAGDIVERAVQLAAGRYGQHQVDQGKGSNAQGLANWWLQENAEGARVRAAQLTQTHDLTVTQLADALVSGNPTWLNAYRRRAPEPDIDPGEPKAVAALAATARLRLAHPLAQEEPA